MWFPNFKPIYIFNTLFVCFTPLLKKKKKKERKKREIMQWIFHSRNEFTGKRLGIFPLILSDPASARRRARADFGLRHGALLTTQNLSSFNILFPDVSVETGKGVNGTSAICPKNVASGSGGNLGDRIFQRVKGNRPMYSPVPNCRLGVSTD